MKRIVFLFCLLSTSLHAETLPDLTLPVAPGAVFDSNSSVKLAMEMTTLLDDQFSNDHYADIILDVTARLMGKFPGSTGPFRDDQGRTVFNDGESKEPQWHIEIDGNVNRRPVIEVTTPHVKSSRVEVFDRTMEVFNQMSAHPSREIGGGHIRVRIKKKNINPAQMASFLKMYYSYQDIINFSFRRDKRSHLMAAPMMDEKNHFEKFQLVLQKLQSGDKRSYEVHRQDNSAEWNMDLVGGFLRNRGIAYGLDGKSYDKFFDFNIGRLYRSYTNKEKDSMDFEFRLFDAPLDKAEARLHLKFMKAFFQLAMNTDSRFDRLYLGRMRMWRSNKDLYRENLLETLKILGLGFIEYEYLIDLNTY